MSRSGYDDECDGWALICWRGAVAAAIRGKRGQKLFKEMLSALDTMPEKKLIKENLEFNGQSCALGCLGKAKGIDMTNLDPENSRAVSKVFDIAEALAKEIVYMNDDRYEHETPEQVWIRMRKWVSDQIIPEKFPSPV